MTYKKTLLYFLNRLIDFIFRAKQPGSVMVKLGALLVGGGPLVAGLFYKKIEQSINGSTETFIGFSNSSNLEAVPVVLGSLLIVIGMVVWLRSLWEDSRLAKKQRLVVIEQRGLINSSDNTLLDFVKDDCRGQEIPIFTDIREKIIDGIVTHPKVALEKVKSLPMILQTHTSNIASSDIKIVHGGMLPVPFTFLSGILLDDESKIIAYDWDRSIESWREIEGDDDLDRFEIIEPSSPDCSSEIVLAISVSYQTDIDNIKLSFPGMDLFEMRLSHISSNNHWSLEKQSAIANQFFGFVKDLQAKGVKKINLVVAAQNSVVFKFGRIYDKRNLPEAVIWQYERTESPVFNWGVKLPVGSVIFPQIVKR
jgi:hypothetical protein